MNTKRAVIYFVIFIGIGFSGSNAVFAKVGCVGRFTNPVTDVLWRCLMPIKISGISIVSGDVDTPTPSGVLGKAVCVCPRLGIPVPVPGIPISFWEPARLVDVTKSPMCMVGLDGISLGTSSVKGFKDDSEGEAFYVVKWDRVNTLAFRRIL